MRRLAFVVMLLCMPAFAAPPQLSPVVPGRALSFQYAGGFTRLSRRRPWPAA